MADWGQWWHGLTTLNQLFYSGALFFTILFTWQMVGSFLGLIDVHDLDVSHPDAGGFGHADTGAAHASAGHIATGQGGIAHAGTSDSSHTQTYPGHEPVADFRLLTVRSILAFFTLFSWAGALYLSNQTGVFWSICYAAIWGTAGMFSVAVAFYALQRMVETGTPNIATCVGTRGVIYLDIPAEGQGEARVLVSGAISHVRARSNQGQPIKAGTPVRVIRALSSTTIEVVPAMETTNT